MERGGRLMTHEQVGDPSGQAPDADEILLVSVKTPVARTVDIEARGKPYERAVPDGDAQLGVGQRELTPLRREGFGVHAGEYGKSATSCRPPSRTVHNGSGAPVDRSSEDGSITWQRPYALPGDGTIR